MNESNVDPRTTAAERYAKRRHRSIEQDAIVPWSAAACAEIARWTEVVVLEAVKAARGGLKIPKWNAVEPWVHGLLAAHLDDRRDRRERGEVVEAGAHVLVNERYMQQLLADPPMPVMRAVFAAYAERFGGGDVERRPDKMKTADVELLQALIDMVEVGREIAPDDVGGDVESALVAWVATCVPTPSAIKTKRGAHRPRDPVSRAFYDGTRRHFATCGHGEPTASDLTDLSLWCEVEADEDVAATRWERRLTGYRKEDTELAVNPR